MTTVPCFLVQIHSSPIEFQEEFYKYCYARFLRPTVDFLRSLGFDDRLEVVHSIFMHCIKEDESGKLRIEKYDCEKGEFPAWLYVVGLRVYLRWLEKKKREIRMSDLSAFDNSGADYRADAILERAAEKKSGLPLLSQVLAVQSVIKKMSRRCQIIFGFLQDGYESRDVDEFAARMNKMYTNHWIGTQVSRCRSKLRQMLAAEGVPVPKYI